ncbi:uncharacterized protein LOC122026610 [Zingiber officinale]|uniref:uncharacterized protein LOC122026610 n=1 Tax=Zingiber officinale TaxID=94328 RepID=UPI001C4D0754|nr:uncharacterized protein LOC122026610 [Zingiber officinale]
MPFGLKNAGATYQRLMNKVFRKQIGRNLEVYVDDILIKSIRAVNLCADIEETFGMLRTYGVKLNPQKCLFGAKSGRFLRYIVTERGIEANPSKVKILRRATKFQWDAECNKAFEELKVYLNSLPVLAKLVAREALRVYLSSTEYAVGSALVRPDGEEQPVYFLSHILKDAESRYTGLEKLAFKLVLAARRLRPYFLVHPIVVMTNSPLGRVLLNPEASGRLIKWTTELSEFDIRYHPRTTIKVQSLADFVTEVLDPEPEATWRVYVDGSSTQQGSGISVLLISPHGEWMHLSVRLDFRATNNEAEYEALITGLQAARLVGANKSIEQVSLVAHIDRMEWLTFPNDWRMAIAEFLKLGATPSDREDAYLLKKRAGRFILIGDQLYKKAFSRPVLKCVGPEDVDYILQEAHQGSCGGHPGGRLLAGKILLAGYFWPTLQEDAARIVATCLSCQKYHNFSHCPTEELKTSTVSCPFDQWGMDIVGPFPMVTGQRKFLLVAVDYFSKWVEVELFAKITEQMVKKFIWLNIICRFDIP